MAFPSQINNTLSFGIPGEFYAYGPSRVVPAVLRSANAGYNIFGRAYTWNADGLSVTAGGSGAFAGIMVNPKAYPMFGDSNNPLNPSLHLPNGMDVEFCSMGILVATFIAAASIGQKVVYSTANGILYTVDATATDPGNGNAFVPNAYVSHYTTAGAGPAVITLTN